MERVSLHLQPPIEWPQPDTRAYLEPLWLGPLQRYVGNLRTDLALAVVDGEALPLTLPRPWRGNSYLCSPLNQYLGYTRELLSKSRAPWTARGLDGPMAWMATLDRVVQVNNWLLSTNLYPPLQATALAPLHHLLLAHFPQRALLFRSLDCRRNAHLIHGLRVLGYRAIFSRLVFYKDVSPSSQVWKQRDTRADLKLASTTHYRWRPAQQWSDADFERATQLYRQLYIDKYTPLNPQFTVAYLRHVGQGSFQLLGLFDGDRMDGVIGFWERAGVMTTPILGYATELPQKLGLYRLLCLRIAQEGQQRGLLVHESAGVGRFKRLRGAVAEAEFNLVYHRHLPWPRRLPWWLLEGLINGPGRRLVEWWEA